MAKNKKSDELCKSFEEEVFNKLCLLPKADADILKLEVAIYLFGEIKKYKLSGQLGISSVSSVASGSASSSTCDIGRASDSPYSEVRGGYERLKIILRLFGC